MISEKTWNKTSGSQREKMRKLRSFKKELLSQRGFDAFLWFITHSGDKRSMKYLRPNGVALST